MCLEAKTGKVVWSDQVIGKGSVMYADGHLYTRSEKGMVRLIEPTPDGGKCVGKLDQPEKSGDAKWPYPVVAGGRLYLRDQDNLFCYNVKG
jgi:outer membrane protein assembly factor BamB